MANTFKSLTMTAVLIAGGAASAYAGGTDAQREACTPDAFKLCTTSMPDEGRVETCLRAAGPRLSAPCYAVFYPQSASNQTQTTRGQAPVARQRMQPSAVERPDTTVVPTTSVGDGVE